MYSYVWHIIQKRRVRLVDTHFDSGLCNVGHIRFSVTILLFYEVSTFVYFREEI